MWGFSPCSWFLFSAGNHCYNSLNFNTKRKWKKGISQICVTVCKCTRTKKGHPARRETNGPKGHAETCKERHKHWPVADHWWPAWPSSPLGLLKWGSVFPQLRQKEEDFVWQCFGSAPHTAQATLSNLCITWQKKVIISVMNHLFSPALGL